MKRLLITSLCLMFGLLLRGQTFNPNGTIVSPGNNNAVTFCASDEMTKRLYKSFPSRQTKMDAINAGINYQSKGGMSSSTLGTIYTIPVVVHIIHNNGLENISDGQVIQGIQDLNDGFANQGPYQDVNGVDVEIVFCMAERDPNGNATNGITRDISPLTDMIMEDDDITLKDINRWDPNDYLNIWLVQSITSSSSGPGVAGYAYFPSSHGQPEDGIVCEANYFGSTPGNSAVQIHEVGHYLGLYHTFQGGCTNNDCLNDGDRVCDTPPDNSTAFASCNASVNTCSTDDDDLSANNPFRPIANGGIGDQDDFIKNHMDYGDIACHNSFTDGQRDRMRTALTTSRYSLLQSNGCVSPCNDPMTISFTTSATAVTIGSNVNFNSTSTGNISSYDWSINNVTFASTQSASFPFNTIGNFWVVLTLNNADPNCQEQDSILIRVDCDAQATFTSSATSINPGDQITFTSTTTGATSYQWYIDGIPQVTTPNFTKAFPYVGGFMVYLVTCNSNCCDTSAFQFIRVGLCNSKEANMWYFGENAGLDFNSGSPVPIFNSAMSVLEGCSSISDENGQLLFYTNGVSVWNKNHLVMQNGTGLWGHWSTSQSAIIIKQPGSDSLYYIFTNDVYAGYFSHFYQSIPGAHAYSIVDMSLNGGLGAVISKNNFLYARTCERLAAVRHANGTDAWVVTHKFGTNEYYAYLLTCNGVGSIPVISSVGDTIGDLANPVGWHSHGCMVISPDGRRIAAALHRALLQGLQLGDFNTSTGEISNIKFVSMACSEPYGVAFSIDGNKLYSSCANDKLFQYDASLVDTAAILASEYLVFNGGGGGNGAIQLGPDGKIYSASPANTSCHVIQNPNASGIACGYLFNGLYLGRQSWLGLPNFLTDYFAPKKAAKIQGDSLICDVSTYYINNNCGLSGDSVSWILNGSSTIVSAIDSAITIAPSQAGIDTLISFQYASCGIVSDTLIIQVDTSNQSLNLGNDTTTCDLVAMQLDAGTGFVDYLWSTANTSQTINVNSEGIYWVEVYDSNGCPARDTIEIIQANASPPVDLGPDTMVCPGIVIPIEAGVGYVSYKWQDFSDNQLFTAWLPGTYWVEATDSCGNLSMDTIQVLTVDTVNLSLGADTELCNGEALGLDAGQDYVTYLWQDGSTAQTYTALDSGTYIVQVSTAEGCAYADTILILIDTSGSSLSLGPDTILCNDEEITLNPGSGYITYLWQNGSDAQTYTALDSGIYIVQVSTAEGCAYADTIRIDLCETSITTSPNLVYLPNVFYTSSNNPEHEKLFVFGRNIKSVELTIYDRWDNVVYETMDATEKTRDDGQCCSYGEGWDGTFRNTGKPLNEAVFVFILKGEFTDGKKFNETGNITLIR